MPSIKQIQNRLGNKWNSLNKLNLNMANAEKGKNNTEVRKLTREKGTVDGSVKNLSHFCVR